jgi:hypothetical protein
VNNPGYPLPNDEERGTSPGLLKHIEESGEFRVRSVVKRQRHRVLVRTRVCALDGWPGTSKPPHRPASSTFWTNRVARERDTGSATRV